MNEDKINKSEELDSKIDNTDLVTNEKVTEPIVNTDTVEVSKTKTSLKKNKSSRKEIKAQKLAIKKQKQETKIAERQKKNTRWFWFFILLLITIILLFLWDTRRKSNYIKLQQYTIDTLNNSVHFYKTKYIEKDSSLNTLLGIYNNLLQQSLSSSQDLTDVQKDLVQLQYIVQLQDSILRQVKSSIDIALSGYNADDVSVEMKEGKIYITMRNRLLFPSGSATIQSQGLGALRTIAGVLSSNPNIDVVIEGHTDNVPLNQNDKKYKDNWELSTARAVEVTRILIEKYDVRPERLSAAGRSMYFPIAPNTTNAGRAKNRRIEVILSPNLEELYNLTDTQIQTN